MISWRGKPQVIRCDNSPVLNSSVLRFRFRTGQPNRESGLNTFNKETHSKMRMLKDSTEQFATNGCHDITDQA
jgi:hypothetical protein